MGDSQVVEAVGENAAAGEDKRLREGGCKAPLFFALLFRKFRNEHAIRFGFRGEEGNSAIGFFPR